MGYALKLILLVGILTANMPANADLIATASLIWATPDESSHKAEVTAPNLEGITYIYMEMTARINGTLDNEKDEDLNIPFGNTTGGILTGGLVLGARQDCAHYVAKTVAEFYEGPNKTVETGFKSFTTPPPSGTNCP